MALASWLLLAMPVAMAVQEPEGTATPAPYASGDAWLDGRLADIDVYAARHPEAFLAEIERYAGVPRAYVRSLLQQPGWRAGDAWFACFLAREIEAGCRDVVRARSHAGADADWARVAEEAGADAAAFARLRLALADSYRRWARPLRPDAALVRALREREREAGP
ncbi:hypothetical protein CSC62_00640 [Pseudoxanthomonas jiangsuensis]|uniref:hypothetical protein n=1 Tax=Pseudoxanthomonas jiangsuensis TaxID=619688 RepID=UPI001390FD05|nr:hypothetical protein [Pseudoxanthomonas jiangsuensis]KAF1699443.1 hypothetical protein CSC62_00640 [Pseudoxanthomonas jiangsuensis]